jgi:DNA-binding response OmpR family regulator
MKKILVVDDDPDIAYVVKIILTSNGFVVRTHDSGYHVPEIVKEYQPDLILLDIRLPGKAGTEICKELKAISKRPPILLFSAHAKEGEAYAICNADGFIKKPFEVKGLLQAINAQLVELPAHEEL